MNIVRRRCGVAVILTPSTNVTRTSVTYLLFSYNTSYL